MFAPGRVARGAAAPCSPVRIALLSDSRLGGSRITRRLEYDRHDVTGTRLRTVDAFTERPFTGNPAAVLMLDEMPSDEWMAAVARETNLSDTGFVVHEDLPDADFRLRWFTPTVEIDLCGHATLASAHCLFEDGVQGPIRFATRSGVLTVEQRPDGSLAMDFPAWFSTEVDAASAVSAALGAPVEWTGLTTNGAFLLALMRDEQAVHDLTPDLAAVGALDSSVGLIPTAPADPDRAYDFVSRVFAPQAGIPEDPVTGSAHTVLAPYWADRLGRTSLVGLQASARSGLVGVELNGDRVTVTGRAVTVFDGMFSRAAAPSGQLLVG
jgi:PhzF family phenazine biosynthesis protein